MEHENVDACRTGTRLKTQRFTQEELRQVMNESSCDESDALSDSSDQYECDVSDIESIGEIEEQGSDYDSDVSVETEGIQEFIAKDGTKWNSEPFVQRQSVGRNVIRQKGGPVQFSKLFTAKQLFRSIISDEMCDIILRETNRKLKEVVEQANKNLREKYPNSSRRPCDKKYEPFTTIELEAFFGILIKCGIHKSNTEPLHELWSTQFFPLPRASMSLKRMLMLLKCIRFDSAATRNDRLKTDKAAAIKDLWLMMNHNLEKGYKPHESITVDEQLFGYRGKTKFTQYMPAKPNKYGLKINWACDSFTSYPLKGQIYTGKPPGGERQTNVRERVVLDLVSRYKGSGRNITTDNFFTSLSLALILSSWLLTLVGTVRKNKKFLPASMQPHKTRKEFTTNFAFSKEVTLCS